MPLHVRRRQLPCSQGTGERSAVAGLRPLVTADSHRSLWGRHGSGCPVFRSVTGWHGLQTQPVDGSERKASVQGSDMRSDMVTTPSGRQYSVADWLNGLNSGPFDGFFNRIHMTLTHLSRMTTDCEISDEFYNYILDTYCDVYFSHIGYSRNVSDLIVVTMNLSTSTTASDEALRMIRSVCYDLQVQGQGPYDSPWSYTEIEKQKTLTRLQHRPNAELWWQRKAELVCREGFQSRIRSHGLRGGAARWSGTAIDELMERVAVEECHLKTHLRSVPPAQAVALLSHQAIPGEASPSGESKTVPILFNPTTTAPGLEGLRPCIRKAWSQYQDATRRNAELTTDAQVYEWLETTLEEGDFKLPSFRTWQGSLSKARTALGQNKNRKGVGHQTRSVISIRDK